MIKTIFSWIIPSNADHRKQRGRTAPNRCAGCERGFVPVDELIELRNKLYEADAITMNGLHLLNELIWKYLEE